MYVTEACKSELSQFCLTKGAARMQTPPLHITLQHQEVLTSKLSEYYLNANTVKQNIKKRMPHCSLNCFVTSR